VARRAEDLSPRLGDTEVRSTVNLNTGSGEPHVEQDSSTRAASRTRRYGIKRFHSAGGLGRVWLVRDESIRRDVALKELRPEQSTDPDSRQRFLNEAQITGQLEHPNIVPVYELSDSPESGLPFYTMRFVRGQTLRDAIRDHHRRCEEGRAEPLELRRLLNAFVNLANAIAFAHSRGVLHRDLKPENVILGDFGEIILLDWGLAKVVGAREDEVCVTLDQASDPLLTQPGSVLGTPAYMSPEQAAGHGSRVTERTDVYGLGAVLFEILTGRPPHQGPSVQAIIEAVIRGETPRPRQVSSSVPRGLDAVARKAMAKLPEDRYARASEIADDVQRWLGDEPVSAHRESPGARLGRWVRRHRNWVLAGASALLCVLAVAGAAAVRMAQLAERERDARIHAEHMQENGLRVAAKFAARTVAGEIDLRWRILETEAADTELVRRLSALTRGGAAADPGSRRVLQAWVEARHQWHWDATYSTSWFLTDRAGRQLARAPFSEKSVDQSYAFRDYFHGLGRDLAPAEAGGVEPIRDVHRSVVFESQASGNRVVAFSVPVWGEADPGAQRQVLGVLGMSVELGRFGILQIGLGKDQVALLVDTQANAAGEVGLVLHHPYLAELKLSQPMRQVPTFRLDASRVEALRELRQRALEHERVREALPDDEASLLGDRPYEGSIDRNFRDPAAGDYAGRWLAAFEPVIVRGRAEKVRDTGWVVIVEERAGNESD
jgi:serine/threonine-protein kinase